MEFQRILNLPELLNKKSFFLFGPRSTGKTHLVRHQLQDRAVWIDLLKSETFLRLSQNPTDVEEILQTSGAQKHDLVVIDEVQRIPPLLNEVHRLIEERHLRFLLTGSSARKLKRGQANLLAGRAWTAQLFPLCSAEIPDLRLDYYLRYGGLPHVYQSENPEEELDAYVQTYLKEEILAEGLIRKLPPFSRFLKMAALSNGGQLNFAKIGNDTQVAASTIREYYSILEDTLVGFLLEPWAGSRKRKAVQTAKFYFFDTGVTHTLAGTKQVDRNSNLYGSSFEQFIAMELRACLGYRRIKEPLCFWRSQQGHEVDFLIGERTAIEVKSATRMTQDDRKGLDILREEGIFKDLFLVSHDRIESKKDGIELMHWKTFLDRLWSGAIV